MFDILCFVLQYYTSSEGGKITQEQLFKYCAKVYSGVCSVTGSPPQNESDEDSDEEPSDIIDSGIWCKDMSTLAYRGKVFANRKARDCIGTC